MTDPDLLLLAAYHRERVASRRLARASGISEADALRRTLEQSAGARGLQALLDERAAETASALARSQARDDRQAQLRQQRQQRHDGAATAWRAWFDGSAHPNPGSCSIGGVLQGPDGECVTISRPAGHGNSSQAEYRALIAVLEAALELGPPSLTVYGDSQGVIADVLADELDAAASLADCRAAARALLARLPNTVLRWVPRHKNAHADALSQQAARDALR